MHGCNWGVILLSYLNLIADYSAALGEGVVCKHFIKVKGACFSVNADLDTGESIVCENCFCVICDGCYEVYTVADKLGTCVRSVDHIVLIDNLGCCACVPSSANAEGLNEEALPSYIGCGRCGHVFRNGHCVDNIILVLPLAGAKICCVVPEAKHEGVDYVVLNKSAACVVVGLNDDAGSVVNHIASDCAGNALELNIVV